jgi:hypothetical protein
MKGMQLLKSLVVLSEPGPNLQPIDTRLENILKKKKLQKNPPYQLEKLASKLADNMQPKRSYERAKKTEDLICPYSDNCQFNLDNLDPKVREKIITSDFWEYVRDNHADPGLLTYGYSTPESRLTFSGDLVAPLSRMLGDMKKIALKIFRLIFKICVDRNRPNLPFLKIRKLIEILMNNSAEIKDECFLQLIKQTRDNLQLDPNTNEWRLMAILVSYVTPSEYFIYYFLNYLNTVFTTEKFEDARVWAMFVLQRTLSTNKNTERVVLPLKEEIQAIEERKKMKVDIHFPNGSKEVYFIESFTTISCLKDQVIGKYDLGEEFKLHFGILEVCRKDNAYEETYVDDQVKILDVLSSWTNEYEFQCKKEEVMEVDIRFKLYFKIRFDFAPLTIEHETLQYFECYRAFQKNRLELSFDTWKRLLVLKLRILFGESSEERKTHIIKNFKHIAPKLDRGDIDTVAYNQLIAEVFQGYNDSKLKTPEAMKEFVELCQGSPLYGCELYPVSVFKKDDDQGMKVYELPKWLFLGVKYDQVMLVDIDYKLIKAFPYSQIMKWGFNPTLLILLIQEQYSDKPVKVVFKTRMGGDIVYRMNSMVDMKLGKALQSSAVTVNENVTREIYKDKFFKKVNIFKRRYISFG